MVNKDPVTTKLDLTQDELDTIYQKMVDIDFFSYPKGYHPKLEGDIVSTQTPFTVYYIEYHNENGTKVVYWTTQYTPRRHPISESKGTRPPNPWDHSRQT